MQENSTKDFLDNITKMQRIITDHYQEEIKIVKEITSKEKAIAAKKVELKRLQISLVSLQSKQELNEKINSISKEIETSYKAIEEREITLKNYIKKRSEIKKIIELQNNEYSQNILKDNIEYFLLLLKNLSLESKKFVDSSELKIKDMQLEALTRQIKSNDFISAEKLKTGKNNNASKSHNKDIESVVINSKSKEKGSQAKIIIIDDNLIRGLKGEKSIDKSHIIKSQIEEFKSIKENNNNNNKIIYKINDKQAYDKETNKNDHIKNLKKTVKEVNNENNSHKKNMHDIISKDDIKVAKSENNLDKMDSQRNIKSDINKLNRFNKGNDVLLIKMSKSPKSKLESYNFIQNKDEKNILLNKKSFIDKSNLNGKKSDVN